MFALADIGRPLHVHSVRTPEQYLAAQTSFIATMKQAKPYLSWRDPWRYDGVPVQAIVTNGYWKVVYCACGNAPSVEPAWRLACCFECGAIYEGAALVVPETWRAIEEQLLRRPEMATRNWLPGETVGDLASEMNAHA